MIRRIIANPVILSRGYAWSEMERPMEVKMDLMTIIGLALLVLVLLLGGGQYLGKLELSVHFNPSPSTAHPLPDEQGGGPNTLPANNSRTQWKQNDQCVGRPKNVLFACVNPATGQLQQGCWCS
jgi:hypothetical protein